jgi:hypothetical protein
MFSDAEKQVLDQFIINGGKTLWLVEQVNVEMDSLCFRIYICVSKGSEFE